MGHRVVVPTPPPALAAPGYLIPANAFPRNELYVATAAEAVTEQLDVGGPASVTGRALNLPLSELPGHSVGLVKMLLGRTLPSWDPLAVVVELVVLLLAMFFFGVDLTIIRHAPSMHRKTCSPSTCAVVRLLLWWWRGQLG